MGKNLYASPLLTALVAGDDVSRRRTQGWHRFVRRYSSRAQNFLVHWRYMILQTKHHFNREESTRTLRARLLYELLTTGDQTRRGCNVGGSFGLGVVPTSMKNLAPRKHEDSFVQLVLSSMRCHSARYSLLFLQSS